MAWTDWLKRGVGALTGGGNNPGTYTSDPYGAGANIFQGVGMGMQPQSPSSVPGYSPAFGVGGIPDLTQPSSGGGGSPLAKSPGAGAGYGGISQPDQDPGLTSMDKWLLALQGGGLLARVYGGYQQGKREDEIFDIQKQDRARDIEREERRRRALESSAPSVLGSLMKRY